MARAATLEQVEYLVNALSSEPDMTYETFLDGMLATHWEPARNMIVLNYVHANRILPKLDNSIRDRFQEYYNRFYSLDKVLTKMATIERTLDSLDMIPMEREPNDQCDYSFFEIVLARLAGK